jgi:hypothetical protein
VHGLWQARRRRAAGLQLERPWPDRRHGLPLIGFAIRTLIAYLQAMPRKPIELAPAVARNFLKDLRAFYAEKNSIKKDEIAARQAWLLNQHIKPREKQLSQLDVRDMFLQMRDHL